MAATNFEGQSEKSLSFAKIAATGLSLSKTLEHGSEQNSRGGSTSPANIDHNRRPDGEDAADKVSRSIFPQIGPVVTDKRDPSYEVVTSPEPPIIIGAPARAAAQSEISKPSSVDGKSTTSLNAFTMDEKGSIRPDDSASMAAVEDEDSASPPGTGAHDLSQISDGGARAFQEQLNEISTIDAHAARAINPSFGAIAAPSSAGFMPVSHDGVILHDMPPDTKLLEALENPRDRIWVLKLEQDIIDFVKDVKESSLVLPQCNSFYRMLAHKIGDYYMLGHAVDESNSAVRLFKTPASRIARPLTGVATPSTAASTPPPSALQMKILRRGVDLTGPAIANGSSGRSKNNSDNGESSNEDDLRRAFTLEERAARYEAARLRIMGAAKPIESDEVIKEPDESRSSSATGKRKKKQRADSNDDFEARSAYNSYITPSMVPTHSSSSAGFGYTVPQHYTVPSSPTYPGGFGYQDPLGPPNYWHPHNMQPMDPSMMWPQSPQQPYDMSREFDRVMSFQQTPIPNYNATQQPHPRMRYDQQQQTYHPAAYAWSADAMPTSEQQHSFPSPVYPDQVLGEAPHSQPYAYGQLPSQALGRPPNALEHPLPGSYKSRHFNPQSLTFVPGPSTGEAYQPYSPQRSYTGHAHIPTERSVPPSTQTAPTNSPHRQHQSMANSRMQQPASLTHPLPQPVFASHPSTTTVLPPKPLSTPHSSEQAHLIHQQPQHGSSESTLAKWGTPASLPAKPPPPVVDKFESPRSPMLPQRAINNVASPRMPVFGSMPPS